MTATEKAAPIPSEETAAFLEWWKSSGRAEQYDHWQAEQAAYAAWCERFLADRASREERAREDERTAWRAINEGDQIVETIQTFGEITLRNSHPVWVRDADGRVYEAVWTVDDKGRGYWWDTEGESPVEPAEICPHPLTEKQRMEDTPTCGICANPIQIGELCSTDIELDMVHAECAEGSPTVNLETGEPVDGPIHTYRWEGDR